MTQRISASHVGANQAARALVKTFGEAWLEYADHLVTQIAIVFDRPDTDPQHHLGRAIQMLMRMGFSREDLVNAIGDLASSRRASFQQVNPYRPQCVQATRGYRKDWSKPTPDQKIQALVRRIGAPVRAWARSGGLDLLDFYETFEEVNIPSVSDVAREYVIPDPYHSGYPKILRLLAERLRLVLERDYATTLWSSVLEEFPFERLELHPQALDALIALNQDQPSSLLCFPAQFGLRWNGSSMERTTTYVGQPDAKVGLVCREFPLPAYVVLCELIADPMRLLSDDTLAIDCPGDIVTDKKGEEFRSGLSFAYRRKRLHLTVQQRQSFEETRGSATGIIGVKRQHG